MVPILHEDNHLIAVAKPAGLLCQADITGDPDLLEMVRGYIRETYQKPGNVYLGLLHRIDRPVSGVVIFAKTSKAAERMSKMFQGREIRKVYHAVTVKPPQPPSGRLVHFLSQSEGTKIIMHASSNPEKGKKSSLVYETIGVRDQMALLKVELETGRKHQIRVQLSALGSPIVGDLKYGAPSPLEDQSIALHAHSLEFEHPVNRQMIRIQAPHPLCYPWNLFESHWVD
jgi:23S rRNA pseudouridine1911/1915/1917 synthase